MIGEQRTVALDKVEQVRHLLQVRWNVRVVTREVGIVELNVDNVLNIAFGGVELATILCSTMRTHNCLCEWQTYKSQCHRQERYQNKYACEMILPESFHLGHSSSSLKS